MLPTNEASCFCGVKADGFRSLVGGISVAIFKIGGNRQMGCVGDGFCISESFIAAGQRRLFRKCAGPR